jgi:hypothetical protein
LAARLTTLLCKKNTAGKFKEVKTGCNLGRKAMAQNAVLTMMINIIMPFTYAYRPV